MGVRFRSALQEFASEPRGTPLLPGRPPCQRHWIEARGQWQEAISQRVTKWNAFRASAETAADVRRAFLQALEVDPASPLWEDFQPGSGVAPPLPSPFAEAALEGATFRATLLFGIVLAIPTLAILSIGWFVC